jgi:hypothetical protein
MAALILATVLLTCSWLSELLGRKLPLPPSLGQRLWLGLGGGSEVSR